MRQSSQAEAQSGSENSGLRSGSDLQRRFPLAILMYAVLAALVWFTMDGSKVDVFGKPVDLRMVPLIVIGGMALRTVLAVQADKIRHGGSRDGSES